MGHVLLMASRRCFLCRRPTDNDDHDWRLVDVDGIPRVCCDDCWEKRDDDYLTERLDMTEDTDA